MFNINTFKSMFWSFFVFFVSLFINFSPVFAAEIIIDTETNLSADKAYSENLYIGSFNADIKSKINSDLTTLAGQSSIESIVYSDIFSGGGSVDFSGEVYGDLRIISGEVKVSGKVRGDLLILGGDVFIEKNADILGDVLIFAGKVQIDGSLNNNRKIKIISGETKIAGSLSGLIEITTQKMFISNTANIFGQFIYFAPSKMSLENGATMKAETKFNQINSIKDIGIIKKTLVSFFSFWYLLRFITTLIIAFILVYIFKVFTTETVAIISKSFWKSSLYGILFIFFIPLIITVLIISLVGLPIGMIILFSLFSLYIIVPAMSGIIIGSFIYKKFADRKNLKNTDNSKISEYKIDFHSASVGVVLLTLIQFVPILGNIAKLIISVATIGAIVYFIYKSIIK